MSDQAVILPNDSSMRGSFWQKDTLIIHILFELQPIVMFSPVANYGDQSLDSIISRLKLGHLDLYPVCRSFATQFYHKQAQTWPLRFIPDPPVICYKITRFYHKQAQTWPLRFISSLSVICNTILS